jgi:hypothetical protein
LAIHGTVVDERGRTAAGAKVLLSPLDASSENLKASPPAQTQANAHGSFVFAGVGEGVWELSAVTQSGGPSGSKPAGSTVISLATHDLDDVRIRVLQPFTQEASVTWEGEESTGPALGTPQIVLIPSDDVPKHRIYAAYDDAHWQRIQDVYPGRYRIRAPRQSGYYLASVRLGERDVLGEEVDLEPGTPPIHVVYRRNGGRLTGITGTAGACSVVIRPEGLNVPELEEHIECNSKGAFQTSILRPGRYLLWVFDRVDWDAWNTGAFGSLDRYATSIDVAAGATVFLHAEVMSWPR